MEDGNCIGEKRGRDDSESDSDCSESKRVRVNSSAGSHHAESYNLVPDATVSDRVESVTDKLESGRVNSVYTESDPDLPDITEMGSPETIKITEDILNILDDPDSDPEIQDLDSVIKSFEEEIHNPDPVTESIGLDYLLGASDDELGLPPAGDQPERKVSYPDPDPSPAVEINEDFAFIDELPSYDSAEFGLGGDNNGSNCDFVTLGGLFDYSEATEFSWRSESLSAL